MKIRFAQYGVAHAHAAGKAGVLRANPDVEFCGVYEPDPAVRQERGAQEAYQGVHWFTSGDEILADETIAAVAVEGPVSENLGIARKALERGKHVWLDKPAGTDWPAFQDLIALAKGKGLLVQLGYMFRYNAGFEFILDWAREGRLGDVFCVRGRMSTHLDEERRERLSIYQGGILFELLCHLVDIVVTLLGRPERVTSYLRNDLGTVPAFKDNTLTVFEYPKAMAMLESAAIEVSPFASRRLEVYGTRGSAILEPFEEHPSPVLRLCLDEDRNGFVRGWQRVPVEARPRYAASLAALVADIRGEKQPDRSLDHELTVQETVLRAAGVLA
jgi:predicted dehydrogenase